jgi:hypothetical protein
LVIKDLELAKCNMFIFEKGKEIGKEKPKGSKLESFDSKHINEMLSDDDSIDKEDKDLNDCIMQLASLHRPRGLRTSTFSVKPKVRSRVFG